MLKSGSVLRFLVSRNISEIICQPYKINEFHTTREHVQIGNGLFIHYFMLQKVRHGVLNVLHGAYLTERMVQGEQMEIEYNTQIYQNF